MATQDDVRRIALSLPETVEAEEGFGISVWNRGKVTGTLNYNGVYLFNV